MRLDGLSVSEVTTKSAADVAGVRVGDTLTSVDGRPVQAHDEAVRLLCLAKCPTIGIVRTPPMRLTAAIVNQEYDSAVGQLHRQFGNVVRILSKRNVASTKLSQPHRRQLRDHLRTFDTCVVCGFRSGYPLPFRHYPGVAARHISSAHILKTEADCQELGLDFDITNFLPLCGAENEVPSCHSAFDRFQMCFTKRDSDDHVWMVSTQEPDYVHLDGRAVDLGGTMPHKRSLHGHTAVCLLTGSVATSPMVSMQVTPDASSEGGSND
jgi:hypothetical protein